MLPVTKTISFVILLIEQTLPTYVMRQSIPMRSNKIYVFQVHMHDQPRTQQVDVAISDVASSTTVITNSHICIRDKGGNANNIFWLAESLNL